MGELLRRRARKGESLAQRALVRGQEVDREQSRAFDHGGRVGVLREAHEHGRWGEGDRQEGVHGETRVQRPIARGDDRDTGRPAGHQVSELGPVDWCGRGCGLHSSRHLNKRMASRNTTIEPMRTTNRSVSAREVLENSITWFIPSIT